MFKARKGVYTYSNPKVTTLTSHMECVTLEEIIPGSKGWDKAASADLTFIFLSFFLFVCFPNFMEI